MGSYKVKKRSYKVKKKENMGRRRGEKTGKSCRKSSGRIAPDQQEEATISVAQQPDPVRVPSGPEASSSSLFFSIDEWPSHGPLFIPKRCPAPACIRPTSSVQKHLILVRTNMTKSKGMRA